MKRPNAKAIKAQKSIARRFIPDIEPAIIFGCIFVLFLFLFLFLFLL